MSEHPVNQPIIAVHLPCDEHGNPLDYIVNRNCTRIEACVKSGMFADIPYIRIWDSNECLAEVCQHHVGFIRFGSQSEPPHE